MSRRRKRRGSFDPGRLIAGIALSAGALALLLSFYNPISRASEPGVMPFTVEDLPEVTGTTEPSQLMLASKQVVQVVLRRASDESWDDAVTGPVAADSFDTGEP